MADIYTTDDGAWVEIMPATETGYCTVKDGNVVVINAAAQPATGDLSGSMASYGDVISGYANEPTWARSLALGAIARVSQHNV